MIFKSIVIVVVVVFAASGAVSGRGFRSAERDQYVDDDFGDMVGKPLAVAPEANLLEKGKPVGEPGPDPGHHALDQDADKRRKFVNGRNNHFQSLNVSLEFPSGKENETWNVEKKEKTLDLGKEVIKTCQVTTEELVATAQATVTRALKGLCNSRTLVPLEEGSRTPKSTTRQQLAEEMDERFEDLENSIATHMNTIKQMILSLEDRLGEHGNAVMYGQKQLSAAISKGFANGNGGSLSSSSDFNNKNQKPAAEYPGTKVSLNGKDVDGSDEEEDVSGTRDPEILKFNSSIHMETTLNGPPRKVFTYYWKIKDMMFKLSGWNPRKSLRSQSFYIFPSGYRMYMRVFPRKNEDQFYVRVGLTKGEFDDTLKWPFPLKHKIHILDQTKEGRLFEDIASRIWDPNLLCSDFNWQKPIKGDNHECVEIGFPHDVLRQREYIRKDALVVKLTVYLES